jgi:hypothetical protein
MPLHRDIIFARKEIYAMETQLLHLGLTFVLAFLGESAIEFLIAPVFNIPKLVAYKDVLKYISALVGVGLAYAYQVDLVAIFQSVTTPTTPTLVGIALTGIGIGRGSNWLHQFVSKFFPQAAAKLK